VGVVQRGGGAGTAVGVPPIGVGDPDAVQPQGGRIGAVGTGGGCGSGGGGGGHGGQFPPSASRGSMRVTRRVAMTEPIRPMPITPATGTATVMAEASNGATADSAAP